jgi:RNA polymerase sigma-54 factor
MNQVSSKAIKALIKKIVEAEPSTKPISDGAISDLLAREGYQVARRTVAKYREALRIPPVSLRKSWPAKK